jgi:hypothetical protein
MEPGAQQKDLGMHRLRAHVKATRNKRGVTSPRAAATETSSLAERTRQGCVDP